MGITILIAHSKEAIASWRLIPSWSTLITNLRLSSGMLIIKSQKRSPTKIIIILRRWRMSW